MEVVVAVEEVEGSPARLEVPGEELAHSAEAADERDAWCVHARSLALVGGQPQARRQGASHSTPMSEGRAPGVSARCSPDAESVAS